ncbi:PQ loop repeat-domain-containing protein [Aspergillus cavernicola]|uniref:PQ loop repeat-domain-containing protein n=1 Tax=Aspergillus cavernicola TaxID=176166 RepID=A0ABR4IDS3_9EURO
MFPPQNLNIDLEALSGICGSISIACWVVVFSPQIIENFRRGSADGLSLLFLVVWLAGDVFNILGAVMQGVLPTMIILAVYYTLADIVLLGQCFYYRGFTLKDDASASSSVEDPDEAETPSPVISRKPTEHTSLLSTHESHNYHSNMNIAGPSTSRTTNGHTSTAPLPSPSHRRHSASSFLHPSVDGTHLSPVTPFIEPSTPTRKTKSISTLQSILFNLSAVILVCVAGILGWYISRSAPPSHKKHTGHHHHTPDDDNSSNSNPALSFDTLGQVFGYLCAVLYLGSRLPQILLNYKRKSTDGVSLLFFLFACIGNLTYVLSILAYSPICEGGRRCRGDDVGRVYGRYVLVNLSWLIGSFGTLFLDMCIFIQFFLYQGSAGKAGSTMVVS